MSEAILQVNNVTKNYGDFRAVNGISFSIPRGKVIGFLGPNGAGKTTTIHMLLGLVHKNGGTVTYFGKDFDHNRIEILQRINFTSAFNTLLGRISVWENLIVFANLYNVKHPKEKIRSLLSYFEITDLTNDLYKNLSAGQRTRVNLVKALLNDPELILMDEPTASLDPDIADKTLELIETLKHERNLSILYTSHNMNEVTRLCDEVIFLDHGTIVAHDTPLNLTKQISEATLILTFENGREDVEQYMRDNRHNYTFSDHQTVAVSTHESAIPKTLFAISNAGISITDIEIKKPNLEDVFLQIARNKSL